MPVAKEQIRQIIADNNLSSVADVYTLLRDGFKDILQELMEAELDATLGYEKNNKGNVETSNKRNVPQRQLPGKDALSGQPECGEEVDTEIPELEPGAEPADSPLWGTADPASVK